MGQLQGEPPDFAGLYAEPIIERIVDTLTDHQFEHFVGYVFEQAGYVVEDTAGQYGQGLDLKLYIRMAHAPLLHAGVSVKRFRPPSMPAPHTQVQVHHVMELKGALVGQTGVSGSVVTTGTFTGPAHAKALENPQAWPIDGKHLVRYINYVRGSRAVEAEDTEPDVRLRTNPLAPIPPEVLLAADDIMRRPQRQTKVLTVANHKGGVGKTTTALNLAFGLAALDQQVLLVDMDAQANLTKVLPAQAPEATPRHIGEYFTHKRPLAALVRQTQFKRVWLIPSDTALTRSDSGIAAGPGAELRFVRDLHASDIAPPEVLAARPFDWIILDTGPSMGFFTRAAIAASHYVLMPIEPSVFTDLGANLLVETVAAMSALIGAPIKILGSLVTQWKQDGMHESLLTLAKPNLEGAGIPVLKAMIPLDKNNIEKAYLEAGEGQKKTLFSHHKQSKAALGYAAAVREIQNHVVARIE